MSILNASQPHTATIINLLKTFIHIRFVDPEKLSAQYRFKNIINKNI